jgi:hypothetical protein
LPARGRAWPVGSLTFLSRSHWWRAARVFFSKGGERSKIKPVGYAFIVLLVVSAAVRSLRSLLQGGAAHADKIIRDEERRRRTPEERS